MHWMQSTHAEQSLALVGKLGLLQKKGVLLIDDDEMFRALFKQVCDALGVPVTCHASLAEMHSFAALKDFDVAVFDYYLESFRGPEIAEYVDVFFRELPVILISGNEIDGDTQRAWPSCIRRFVSKSSGPYAILERALDSVASARGVPRAKASCDLG